MVLAAAEVRDTDDVVRSTVNPPAPDRSVMVRISSGPVVTSTLTVAGLSLLKVF